MQHEFDEIAQCNDIQCHLIYIAFLTLRFYALNLGVNLTELSGTYF